MALFQKSKEESLKTLSEKEIQQRLYGSYHQERSVLISSGKKSAKSADLKSLEVTPAGILQTDMFRSETKNQTLVEDETDRSNERTEFRADAADRLDFRKNKPVLDSEETKSDLDEGEAGDEASISGPSMKKAIRKPARRSKKDKKRTEAVQKAFDAFLEKTFSALKIACTGLSRGFAALVMWLSESRGESRRVPAKFILVSLAVIGTGLIIFNVWSSHLKQNAATSARDAFGLQEGTGQIATKVVPVASDALSKVQETGAQNAIQTKKYFSIQVCVAQSEQGAANVVRKLKLGGLPAFYDTGSSRRGGKLYRVMIGKFESFQRAKRELEAYKKTKIMEPYQDSFIRNFMVQL